MILFVCVPMVTSCSQFSCPASLVFVLARGLWVGRLVDGGGVTVGATLMLVGLVVQSSADTSLSGIIIEAGRYSWMEILGATVFSTGVALIIQFSLIDSLDVAADID